MKQQVYNPFLPLWEYIPDGEPHVFGNRLYLYGSHDKEAGPTFCMLDYAGWSAPVDDLSDWSCSGSIYSAKQDPLYHPKKMPYMYAPDVVRGNDGRYYLYYCMSGDFGFGGYMNPVSVAVCDTPDGRFEYLGVVRDQSGSPLMRYVCFDPAVINDNGVIRLYYGTVTPWLDQIPVQHLREKAYCENFGRTLGQLRAVPEGITGAFCVTLADDMLTAVSKPTRIDDHITGAGYKDHLFFEGSSIRRIGDRYYFIYSSVNNHELCYAVSQYPDRDFRFGGTIVSNGDIGYQGRKPANRLNHTGTNHGSIECVNGKWYVFYHRLTHLSDYSRQACAEPITVLPDGSIPQVEITSCGLNGGPLQGEGTYPAPICCNLTDGKMQHGTNQKKELNNPCVTSGSGERYIKNITDKTLIGYKYFAFSGSADITLTIRGDASGQFDVAVQPDGPAVGSIQVSPAKEWTKVQGRAAFSPGVHPLYFRYHGRGNVELLEFVLSDSDK